MADPDTTAGIVVASLTGGGLLTFITQVVTARIKSRREGQEGSAILVNSAASYAQRLTEDNQTLRQGFDALRAEMHQIRQEQAARDRAQDRRFRAHESWDDDVRRKLAQLDINVPAPPPLYQTEP